MADEPVELEVVTLEQLQQECIDKTVFLPTNDAQENIRRIRKRLEYSALGWVEMTKEEAANARALLNKHVPDLKAVELTGDKDKPFVVEIIRFTDAGK